LPTFISLITETQQGETQIKKSVERASQFQKPWTGENRFLAQVYQSEAFKQAYLAHTERIGAYARAWLRRTIGGAPNGSRSVGNADGRGSR
jgi:hypothetical protein